MEEEEEELAPAVDSSSTAADQQEQEQGNGDSREPPQHGQQQEQEQEHPLLLLEDAGSSSTDDAVKLDVSGGEGSTVKLDRLGPLVVHEDGTVSRIANWANMTDIERNNTLRVLGRRNQLRLGKLRGEENKDADK